MVGPGDEPQTTAPSSETTSSEVTTDSRLHRSEEGIGISSSNDILVSGNTFGTNLAAGVSILHAASRTPPQPDSRGVAVQNNTMNGDRTAEGCYLTDVTCKSNT